MKKIIQILIKLFFLAFVIILSVVGYIVYQLETSIDDVLSLEQKEWLFTSIENTEELPENFYTTIEKYYPDYFTTSFWGASISSINQRNRVFCQCHSIYLPYFPGEPLDKIEKFPINNKLSFQRPVVSLELEDQFSQKKCFNFSMNISEFGMNTHGIKEAVQKFYQKKLNDLTKREIIELITIHQAPLMYNPIRNKEKLNKVVDKILNQKNN